MARRSRHASPAVRFLHDRYVGRDPERLASLQEERSKAEIARQLYELRARTGLTQAELAKRMGTTPSVISRLEDTDYAGPSLTTMRRIAAALGHRVEVRFVPLDDEEDFPQQVLNS